MLAYKTQVKRRFLMIKKMISIILALLMMLSSALVLASCDKKDGETGIATEKSVAEEKQETEEQPEEETEDEKLDTDVVKFIQPDAEDVIGNDLPMQMESVALYKDGSVVIIPTGDLKENELGDSKATSLMPFAEFGKATELYVYRIGNGGYRTVVALMDDGTVSAINTGALIEDHIIAVKNNLGGRDSFTGVEQKESEDGFSIVGKTEEGDDVILDPVILSEDEEVQPAE